ncbi:LuxR C-terminal-related transcriptional regulator [Pandoraea sp. NPDC090278]|uniref:LuxR C-terminal-related transcriptional regulator n=1 Tax=Pandoraea sp. NPDC090278 TaxID=3364391 RepID=UPI00383B1E86
MQFHALLVFDDILRAEGMVSILTANFAARSEVMQTARDVLFALEARTWDVLILDLDIHDVATEALFEQVRRRYAKVPILALDSTRNSTRTVRALSSGARGVIGCGDRAGDVVEAIRKICSGRKYVHALGTEALTNHFANESDGKQPRALSGRELDTLIAIGHGLNLTETSQRMNISVKSVSVYRARLKEKLGARSTQELTAIALRLDYVRDPS